MSVSAIHSHARRAPTSRAIVHNDTTLTYAEFSQAIDKASRHIESLRLPDHGTIAILMEDLLACWLTMLSAQSHGFTTVGVMSAKSLRALDLPDLVALMTTQAELDRLPLLPHELAPVSVLLMPGSATLLAGDRARTSQRPATLDGGHILYTSGSTGTYKKLFLAAQLQQDRNRERVAYCGYDQATTFHCGSFGCWTGAGFKIPMATWEAGGCVIIDQRQDWHLHFGEHGMTHAILMPPMLDELVASLESRDATLLSRDFYLMIGGSFLAAKSADAARARVTHDLHNVFSCTEVNLPVMSARAGAEGGLHWLKPGTGREVQVVTETGDESLAGTEGTLRISITELDYACYLNDPENSAKVFRAGYFYPGDMAVRHEDGRIKVLGRSSQVINVGGRKIATAPMEDAIRSELGLAGVCLFSGLDDAGNAELVVALETESWPDQAHIEWMKREFRSFESIRFTRFDAFPLLPGGTRKLDRRALYQMIYSKDD